MKMVFSSGAFLLLDTVLSTAQSFGPAGHWSWSLLLVLSLWGIIPVGNTIADRLVFPDGPSET